MGEEYDKKYTWVIKNVSSLQSELLHSSPFFAGGSFWSFQVDFTDPDCLSVFLAIYDSLFLAHGWGKRTKLQLTIVNQHNKLLSVTKETEAWFNEDNMYFGISKLIPLTELYAKDGGFVVNGEIIIVAEIYIIEVFGDSSILTREKISPVTVTVTESMDVGGFDVLTSQEKFVKRLFERYPDFASNFRPQNQFLKTSYMSLLLSVIKTLSQSPQKISKKDLDDASAAVISLKVAGFNLDWLEENIDDIKESKERAVAAKSRMHEIDEELKDLEVLLEKEKVDILANNALLDEKLDDVCSLILDMDTY